MRGLMRGPMHGLMHGLMHGPMRVALAFFGFAAIVVGGAGSARAYPAFQLSTGAKRCNQCHVAPAGGGLLSGYGRDESADTVSRGGDGRVLHGLFEPPDWLAFGGDFRVAGLVNATGSADAPGGGMAVASPQLAAFPMQSDLYVQAKWRSVSVHLTLGLRGAVRRTEVEPISLVVSREHFVMWRAAQQGPYVRIGRFFAPFGLRLAEHPVWVRRTLGFHTLEETYNVSGGAVKNEWELHATAFTYDPLRPVVQRARGGSLLGERRVGDALALGAQARVAIESDESRRIGGGYLKWWLEGPRLMLMAEADYVHHTISGVDYANHQLAAYAGLTWFPVQGLLATVAGERFDEDLHDTRATRHAASAHLQWFPRAHFEASLYGRATNTDGKLLMLQLHYYL